MKKKIISNSKKKNQHRNFLKKKRKYDQWIEYREWIILQIFKKKKRKIDITYFNGRSD